MPTQTTPHKKRLLGPILIAIGAIVVVVLGYWLLVGRLHAPFRDSKALLQQELASLHLADTGPSIERFTDGIGLDNLPVITGTYTIPKTTLGAERAKLGATLEAHGYRDIQSGQPQSIQLIPNTGDFMGNKGRFGIDIHLGTANVSDDEFITSFTFSISDSGSR